MPIALCNATVRKRLRAGAFVSAVMLVVALAAVPASSVFAETYYVDNQHPNSSAAGPGTEDGPYYTISAAVTARGGPGVTIVVRPGVYREMITVLVSGEPDAPFVIRGEGPGVVMDGADDYSKVGLWVEPGPVMLTSAHGLQATDHAWLASSVSWSVSQVLVDGRRLKPSTAPPAELPMDAFTWVQGEGLYVNLGGENPGQHEILVGRRPAAFRLGARSWVTIEGFEVKRAQDSAITLYLGCSDVVIARNRVTFSKSYGIKVSGSTRTLIDGNSVSDGSFHGIGLTAGSTDCMVRDNESFRNAQPGVRIAKGIYISSSPNNVLAGNRTYENQDTGIQINAGSHACLLYNNRSWNNGDHGYDHLDAIGTIHLHDVAYGNYKDGFSIEGDSPDTQIYNCISTDNGLTTVRFNLWVNAPSALGFSSGHNIIWNSSSQEPIKFIATKYRLLTDFNAATGEEVHSLQQDPMFADATRGDFMPLPGSPAIDAGDSGVPNWPILDMAGNARYDDPTVPNTGSGPVTYADIGAFEAVPVAVSEAAELATPLPAMGDHRDQLYADNNTTSAGMLALSTGFPNPSRGPVEFALDLPRESQVEWTVYDLQGRTVWSEGRTVGAGRTQLRWDGTGAAGAPAATGIYLVRARVDGAQFTRRIIRF